MPNLKRFVDCVHGNLTARGFGEKRIRDFDHDYTGLVQGFEHDGFSEIEANIRAMARISFVVARDAADKVKAAQTNLKVQAQNASRIQQGLITATGAWNRHTANGHSIAQATKSILVQDRRFQGTSFEGKRNVLLRKYRAALANANVLKTFRKGAYGRQIGGAHLDNVIREIKNPGSTGDVAAANFAKAMVDLDGIMVDDFNRVGGFLEPLPGYIPQRQNPITVMKTNEVEYLKDMDDAAAWNEMRWPNSAPIDPADRANFLKEYRNTITTDGLIRIDPTKFQGMGHSVGKMDAHRIFIFKSADEWLRIHKKYGDGNVFDVLMHHIETMAHKTAAVDTFGRNPEMGFNNARSQALLAASEISTQPGATLRQQQAKDEAATYLDTVVKPMFDVMMHSNPLHTTSRMAAYTVGTASVVNSSMLGSIPFIAVSMDMLQSMVVRAANGMPIFRGMSKYFQGMLIPGQYTKNLELMAQAGHVAETLFASHFAAERWTGSATYIAPVTRALSDGVIRTSGLGRHTDMDRIAPALEMMGMMFRDRAEKFDALPYSLMMKRYGIDEAMWDTFRKNMTPWQPKPGVNYFRPLDILNTKLVNKHEIYERFAVMIDTEIHTMVPGTTVEAQVFLKGSSRPDTLLGIIGHSFGMFKNFPVTFFNTYGRVAMALQTHKGRTAFIAALGIGGLMAGTLSVQLRELSKGRDPIPWDDPRLYMKGFLSGGSLGIWGDFLFAGINEFGGGPEETVAGPLFGLMGDTAELLLSEPFGFVEAMSKGEPYAWGEKFAGNLVPYLKRYTPGSNLWFSRLVMERFIWDSLQTLIDPKAAQKQRNAVRSRRRDFGQEYYWPPGAGGAERAPNFFGGDNGR